MGQTAESWDQTDRAKVRHMLKRGKSVAFIHEYTGMPVELIEGISKRLFGDRLKNGSIERDGMTYNWLSKQPPIAPNPRAEKRERDALLVMNREYVARVRELGLAA